MVRGSNLLMDGRHPIPQDWDLDSMNVGVYVEGGNVRSIFAIAMSSPRFVVMLKITLTKSGGRRSLASSLGIR